MNNNYEILTPEDVMDLLYIGRNAVYKLLNSGELKAFRVGRNWKIPRKAVDDYISSQSGLNDWYRFYTKISQSFYLF